jgi:succinate-acetate transporter protein
MAFVVVALLCFAAGLKSANGTIFMSLGGFWLIMALVVRRKYFRKPPASVST